MKREVFGEDTGRLAESFGPDDPAPGIHPRAFLIGIPAGLALWAIIIFGSAWLWNVGAVLGAKWAWGETYEETAE